MDKTAEIFKSLGNETRLSIVRELARRGCEVSSQQILTSCSAALDLAQPTLSQHFARLVASGVLLERKDGIEKLYVLNTPLLASVGINVQKLQDGENHE